MAGVGRHEPLLKWFASRGWEAFPFQREVWRAWLEGHSGLLHAPTGQGKTLAVWGGPLLEGLLAHLKPAVLKPFPALLIAFG